MLLVASYQNGLACGVWMASRAVNVIMRCNLWMVRLLMTAFS
jgi:hypothetical protein